MVLLGQALEAAGRTSEAIEQYRRALNVALGTAGTGPAERVGRHVMSDFAGTFSRT